MNDLLNGMRDSIALLSTLAVSGIAFVRLLIHSRRTDGFSAIGPPAILAAYSVAIMLPLQPLLVWPGILGLLLSLVSGFALDQEGSSQNISKSGQRKNSRPLALWGCGALLYILAPAGNYLEGWRQTLENWSAAAVWVGVGALMGQIVNQLWRRFAAGPLSLSPRISRVGGSLAAAIALWLFLPSFGLGTFGAGAKAPANSFLVGTNMLDNRPLYILDIATASYRPLNVQGGVAHWSPDGTRMAMTRSVQGSMQLFASNADGSGLLQLANVRGVIDSVWAPSGERIYFTHGESFLQSEMSVVSSQGGAVEKVLPLSEAVTFPRVSPDGLKLAYFKSTDFGAGPHAPPKAIKILDLSTHQTTEVMSQPSNDWDVTALAWTPDGQALIISSQTMNKGPAQLLRISISDHKISAVGKPLAFNLRSFTWTSGGTALAMIAFPADSKGVLGKGEIWLVDPASGNRRRLETNSNLPEQPLSIHASN